MTERNSRLFPTRMTAYGFKTQGDRISGGQPTGRLPLILRYLSISANLFILQVEPDFLKISQGSHFSYLPLPRHTSQVLTSF
jgi:hypothetical protein